MTHPSLQQLARGADAWSMTELVQAIVILTTFHSLASLAYGCGLVCDDETEQDMAAAGVQQPSTPVGVDDNSAFVISCQFRCAIVL